MLYTLFSLKQMSWTLGKIKMVKKNMGLKFQKYVPFTLKLFIKHRDLIFEECSH